MTRIQRVLRFFGFWRFRFYRRWVGGRWAERYIEPTVHSSGQSCLRWEQDNAAGFNDVTYAIEQWPKTPKAPKAPKNGDSDQDDDDDPEYRIAYDVARCKVGCVLTATKLRDARAHLAERVEMVATNRALLAKKLAAGRPRWSYMHLDRDIERDLKTIITIEAEIAALEGQS